MWADTHFALWYNGTHPLYLNPVPSQSCSYGYSSNGCKSGTVLQCAQITLTKQWATDVFRLAGSPSRGWAATSLRMCQPSLEGMCYQDAFYFFAKTISVLLATLTCHSILQMYLGIYNIDLILAFHLRPSPAIGSIHAGCREWVAAFCFSLGWQVLRAEYGTFSLPCRAHVLVESNAPPLAHGIRIVTFSPAGGTPHTG